MNSLLVRGSAVIILLLMFAAPSSSSAGMALPRFADYPADDKFTGNPALPDIKSAPNVRKFTSRIREGARTGPNFAGRYTIVDWGCGSDCQAFVIVDAKTGAIHSPAFTSSRGLLYRSDSSLLIVNPFTAEVLSGGNPPDWLVSRYYTWDGKQLTQIAENRTAAIDPQTGAASAPAQQKKRTIIDYFNLTKDSEEPKIVQKGGSWQIEGPGGPITLTVADIANGYIEFIDSGTGGGSRTVTAALFLAGNGEPMLAALEAGSTTGTCPDPTYALKIFHMEMGRMDQIRKVLPELPLSLFLNKGYDPKKSAPHLAADSHFRIGYKLPRKGTTMEVFLDTSNLVCGMAMSGGDMPKKEREEQESFLQNVRKEPVKLKWDKASGTFAIQADR